MLHLFCYINDTVSFTLVIHLFPGHGFLFPANLLSRTRAHDALLHYWVERISSLVVLYFLLRLDFGQRNRHVVSWPSPTNIRNNDFIISYPVHLLVTVKCFLQQGCCLSPYQGAACFQLQLVVKLSWSNMMLTSWLNKILLSSLSENLHWGLKLIQMHYLRWRSTMLHRALPQTCWKGKKRIKIERTCLYGMQTKYRNVHATRVSN